ncbi:UNVERIFIED_CONTAM: hypothetical protein PYX00_006440 [Menopon gallinae]|uniref:DUF229 domain containing protein n=1 Tax=Menopon gallinae TaxID=328185 RepID=A0AAW2HWV6_9NEOP
MLERIKKVQKTYLLVIPLLVATITLYMLNYRQTLEPKIKMFKTNPNMSRFVVNTPGCRIPMLYPFHDAARDFFGLKPHFSCGNKPPLIDSNQTALWVVEEVRSLYGIDNDTFPDCCYTPFTRVPVTPDDKNSDIDNKLQYTGACTPFVGSANIHHEFVRVTCKWGNNSSYKDFHAFVVPKRPKEEVKAEKTPKASLLIIGIDSSSRLNFHRHLTKTRKTLRSLNAVEFLGFNKVHDNTFSNLIPLLSGHSVDDIKKICWFDTKDHFDLCPFIWKQFSAKGYLTGFGEDSYWYSTFNYWKNGFKTQPTDYYLRPYIVANEDEIGHSLLSNSKWCTGSRFAAQVLYDYAYKFSVNMTESRKKFWGLFWQTSLTHDFMNIFPDADDLLDDLLGKLINAGVFDEAVVILMSDHGIRWGPFRETLQGWLEERLPFLFVSMPQWMKNKYPEAAANLRRNSRALTTHYDVHETMVDLMNLTRLEPPELKRRVSFWNRKAGLSLFLSIPGERTCRHAAIPTEWCTCYESEPVSLQNPIVRRAAMSVVDHINEMLSRYEQCARLFLKKIHSARIEHALVRTDESEKNRKRLLYVVVFSTKPGGAKFEGTVRHHSDSNKLEVEGYVSRINMYGSQSKCVSDHQIKLYCYCI